MCFHLVADLLRTLISRRIVHSFLFSLNGFTCFSHMLENLDIMATSAEIDEFMQGPLVIWV